MPWKHNSRTIREGRGWISDDGLKHPQNWANCWSDADKKSFGLTWEDPPAAFDRRFYWDADTAKSLDDVTQSDGSVAEGLKTQWVRSTKKTANSLLSSSDWYVTRKLESGSAIPDAVQDYRSSVRAKCAEIESTINSVTSIDDFIKLFESSDGSIPEINDWPTVPKGL
tara:strand:- start:1086 stop:1589 length:504 start_codon:yes stop_codon:yes gene_type:complete